MFLHFRFPHPKKKIGISNLLKFLFLGAGQHVAKKTFFPFLKINLEGGWIPVKIMASNSKFKMKFQ
jgi:hypothetical protein